jgi:hypothetical protein
MGPKDSTTTWLSQMQDHYATGDYTGALAYAERILEQDATHEGARRHAARCRTVLTEMLRGRLGPTDRAVERSASAAELRWLKLDAVAERVLALADGRRSLDELLLESGLPELEALKLVSSLLERHVLALRERPR